MTQVAGLPKTVRLFLLVDAFASGFSASFLVQVCQAAQFVHGQFPVCVSVYHWAVSTKTFMGPGDWAVGLLKVAIARQQAGDDIKLGYIGFDHRDHFFAICRVRMLNCAAEAFNSSSLVVDGMTPLPSNAEGLAPC